MTTAREVKMPVKIQADAGEATASLKRLRSQFGGLDKAIGQSLRSEAKYLGSQFVGFLSIQALMSGLRMLVQYGREVNQIAAKWDAGTIEAQAQTSVAQMRQEQAIASAVGPIAQATEAEKQRQAERRNFAPEVVASIADYQYERMKRMGFENVAAAGELFERPSLSSAAGLARTAAGTATELVPQLDPRYAVGLGDPESIPARLVQTFADFLKETFGTSESEKSNLTPGIDPQAIDSLREIARNTRGKP